MTVALNQYEPDRLRVDYTVTNSTTEPVLAAVSDVIVVVDETTPGGVAFVLWSAAAGDGSDQVQEPMVGMLLLPEGDVLDVAGMRVELPLVGRQLRGPEEVDLPESPTSYRMCVGFVTGEFASAVAAREKEQRGEPVSQGPVFIASSEAAIDTFACSQPVEFPAG